MTNEQKALVYYKAVALREAPAFVPVRVRLTNEVFGDFPFRGAGVSAGDHDCFCNPYGAVSVKDRDGKLLGLRLNEFEPLAWRDNVTAAGLECA